MSPFVCVCLCLRVCCMCGVYLRLCVHVSAHLSSLGSGVNSPKLSPSSSAVLSMATSCGLSSEATLLCSEASTVPEGGDLKIGFQIHKGVFCILNLLHELITVAGKKQL